MDDHLPSGNRPTPEEPAAAGDPPPPAATPRYGPAARPPPRYGEPAAPGPYPPPPQYGAPGQYPPPPQYAPGQYPPSQYPPPPQYATAGYGAPARTNGMAIASMVLGILWLYWIGSILALIFGYSAIRQIDRSGGVESGRGMAIAGIVLGWVGVGTLTLFIVLMIATTATRA